MASKINVDKIARGSGTPEFTIPTADGTAGQFLKTDASGVLSFGSGVALTGSTNNTIPTVTGANALAGEANFTYDGNTLDIKNAGTASSINLYCESSNAHYTKIKSGPHASATSYTITLPNAPPSVSGQALTATTAGVGSWATVNGVSAPAFAATAVADQAVSDAVLTKSTMSTEVFDSNSAYDHSTNYRFTVPAGEGGKYFVYADITFHSSHGYSDTVSLETQIKKNGSTAINAERAPHASHGGQTMTLYCEGILVLSAADYLEVWGYFDNVQGSTYTFFKSASFGAFKLQGI